MLGVTHVTVGNDVKNSHLGKIYNDLGANWSDQHIADWCRRTACQQVQACRDAGRSHQAEGGCQQAGCWKGYRPGPEKG